MGARANRATINGQSGLRACCRRASTSARQRMLEIVPPRLSGVADIAYDPVVAPLRVLSISARQRRHRLADEILLVTP